MLARTFLYREITSLLITAGMIMLLLLLVVVPAHSQDMVPAPGSFELVQEPSAQSPSTGMLVFLIAQFLFLAVGMTSYLWFEAKNHPVEYHQHWWAHVHLPHHR
ncbi:MAG TPA: hypothetical protein VN577_02950 [Terriglobales bacterium]|nr:hypothetical protein [Terriglobales bacterium]